MWISRISSRATMRTRFQDNIVLFFDIVVLLTVTPRVSFGAPSLNYPEIRTFCCPLVRKTQGVEVRKW